MATFRKTYDRIEIELDGSEVPNLERITELTLSGAITSYGFRILDTRVHVKKEGIVYVLQHKKPLQAKPVSLLIMSILLECASSGANSEVVLKEFAHAEFLKILGDNLSVTLPPHRYVSPILDAADGVMVEILRGENA